jgi:MFS family permease
MTVRTQNLRTFYALILTQTFSLIGSRISSLAVGIWVYGDTGEATPLLLVMFFSNVPQVLASTISGVLADRFDRRKVMILADAGQAVGTVLLLISFASDGFQLWHLYAVTLIQSVFSVFQAPAFQASVTMLIPDEQRERANAIQQMTQPAAGIVAPIIAGFVFAAVGVVGAIAVDLFTFFVAMGVVFSLHIPRPKLSAEGLASQGTIWKEAWAGLQYMWERKILLTVVLFICLLNFLVAGSMGMGSAYILARTGNNETAYGVILSMLNIGAIVGAIIIGSWGGTRPRMNTILPALIVASAFLIGIGVSRTALTLCVTCFFFMLPLPMVNTLFMSIMQVKVPPDLQGRVFASLGQISMLLVPLSYLVAGPLADDVFEPAVNTASWWHVVSPIVGNGAGAGMGLIMVIAGALTVGLSVVMISLRPIRNMEAILPDYIPVAADSFASVDDEVGIADIAPELVTS